MKRAARWAGRDAGGPGLDFDVAAVRSADSGLVIDDYDAFVHTTANRRRDSATAKYRSLSSIDDR